MAELLMIDKLLKEMTGNYNAKHGAVFDEQKKAGTRPADSKYVNLSESDIRAKVIQIIDDDMQKTKGAKIDEMGAHVAIHFGTTGSGYTYDSSIRSTGNEALDQQAQKQKNEEREIAEKKWKEKHAAEMKKYREMVEDYILDGGKREYIKSPMGDKRGIKDTDIVIEDLHLKK